MPPPVSLMAPSVTLLSEEEKEEFNTAYDHIVSTLVDLNLNSFGKKMDQETAWMKTVLDYNVASLNHLRGHMVPLAYKSLLKNTRDATKDGVRLDMVLGWVTEIFHGSHLIAGNIMDEKKQLSNYHREKRGFKASWYQLKNVGMAAINDSFMLRMTSTNIFKLYFSDHPSRHVFEDLYRDATHNCLTGRMLLERIKKSDNFTESYNMDQYRQVVRHHTSFHSFYLPVAYAFALAEKFENSELLHYLKEIMLEIGYYYQLGEDYAEVYNGGNKWSTEHLDRLNWFFVRAVEKCEQSISTGTVTDTLMKLMINNDLKSLQKVYDEVGLRQEYEREREMSLKSIRKKIKEMPDTMKAQISVDFFTKIIDSV